MKKVIILPLALIFAASAVMADPQPEGKKVQLYDKNQWVLIQGDNVKVSKDNGRTWKTAPDGTWDAKDGSKMSTHDGKIVR